MNGSTRTIPFKKLNIIVPREVGGDLECKAMQPAY
jgi:hypothetical protein